MDKQEARQLVADNLENLKQLIRHLANPGLQLWLVSLMLDRWPNQTPSDLQKMLDEAVSRCINPRSPQSYTSFVDVYVQEAATVAFLMQWVDELTRADGCMLPDHLVPDWEVVEALLVLHFPPQEESAAAATR